MLTTLFGPQSWWVWGIIDVICFGGAALLFFMPSSWKGRLGAWLRAISWEHVAYAATIIVLIQFAVPRWDAIAAQTKEIVTSVADGVMALLPDSPNLEHLHTRPACDADCDNFRFRVRECEVAAAGVGGLHRPYPTQRREQRGPPGSADIATEYFRGCLVDQGFSWAPCECGGSGCLLLREFHTAYVPSFMCEPQE